MSLLDVKSDLHRNVADFPPNVWEDYFFQYASESMICKHMFRSFSGNIK